MTPNPASNLMWTVVGSRATQSTKGRRNVGNGPRSFVVSVDGRVASALVDMVPPWLTGLCGEGPSCPFCLRGATSTGGAIPPIS